VTIKEVREKIHHNFQAGYRAHPLRYKGVNLSISTHVQSEVRARAKARMLAKGHVQHGCNNLPLTNQQQNVGGGGGGEEGKVKQHNQSPKKGLEV